MSLAAQRAHRLDVQSHVAREINPLKSRLIDYLSRLEAAEAKAASDRLAKIIGDLETWQARFG